MADSLDALPWRGVRARILFGTVLLLAACGSPTTDRKQGDLKPGDSNYPTAAASPARMLQLVATGPEAADARFTAMYRTDINLCAYEVGLAVSSEYRLGVPIEMVRSGDGYQGSVVLDRFLPGRCGWRFERVDGVIAGTEHQLATAVDAASPGPSILTRDFWCYQVTDAQQKPVHGCEELGDLRWPNTVRLVSPEFVSTFSAWQQNDAAAWREITAVTKEIRINSHDLNAIPGALVSPEDPVVRIKAQEAAEASRAASPQLMVERCVDNANHAYLEAHKGQQLPDSATQQMLVRAMREKCRSDLNVAP